MRATTGHVAARRTLSRPAAAVRSATGCTPTSRRFLSRRHRKRPQPPKSREVCTRTYAKRTADHDDQSRGAVVYATVFPDFFNSRRGTFARIRSVFATPVFPTRPNRIAGADVFFVRSKSDTTRPDEKRGASSRP